MDYKKTARSPNYGRIFAYDTQGREIESLDVLKLRVVQDGTEYIISDLLAAVIEQGNKIEQIQDRIAGYEKLEKKMSMALQLLELFDLRIQSLEIK